jgi:hypothetical protein
MIEWLRQTNHDEEVVSSNPGTVYWMDVSDATYNINIHKNNENNGSQIGHTLKKNLTALTQR